MATDEGDLGSDRGSARPRAERSMAGLVADLADQISSLFHQEVALLKAELLEKLGLIGQGVGAVVAGALIVFSGWLALLAAGGVISVQVLNEFASVASRKLGLSFSQIRELLATIRTACTVKPVDVATHELGIALAEQLAARE